MISVEDVYSGYQPERDIVRGVSLRAHEGKVTTLLGPNGCGKSTLLKTMSRLLTPRVGEVQVGGRNIHGLEAKEAARTVALLPQQPVAPAGLRVGELVARGRHPHRGWIGGPSAADRAAVEAALERTDTAELADRDVAELSGGQRQRVWLALALAQETPVLLLDEPTTYLDPAHALATLHLCRELAREGRTVVMVLHDLMLAGAYSDQMVIMREGQVLASGTPTEALTPETMERAYGLRAEVWPDPQGNAPVIVPRGVSAE
ncbi:ABC transporter ATP-binding protein [Corynebacterium oculi]|uniref:Putative siderophore transport system ATP-binding protein YusV n=1 Tax=Corynebacterium oculi TaxID=1544416 RepID=A0A0Q0YRF2_9CORY|nr:ABC transporter ATP-binding protein [Corynebacterium oculi]KQB84964.1 putative siderophore transport system ATP-binding protein YusV [Corynebacterium oculi]